MNQENRKTPKRIAVSAVSLALAVILLFSSGIGGFAQAAEISGDSSQAVSFEQPENSENNKNVDTAPATGSGLDSVDEIDPEPEPTGEEGQDVDSEPTGEENGDADSEPAGEENGDADSEPAEPEQEKAGALENDKTGKLQPFDASQDAGALAGNVSLTVSSDNANSYQTYYDEKNKVEPHELDVKISLTITNMGSNTIDGATIKLPYDTMLSTLEDINGDTGYYFELSDDTKAYLAGLKTSSDSKVTLVDAGSDALVITLDNGLGDCTETINLKFVFNPNYKSQVPGGTTLWAIAPVFNATDMAEVAAGEVSVTSSPVDTAPVNSLLYESPLPESGNATPVEGKTAIYTSGNVSTGIYFKVIKFYKWNLDTAVDDQYLYFDVPQDSTFSRMLAEGKFIKQSDSVDIKGKPYDRYICEVDPKDPGATWEMMYGGDADSSLLNSQITFTPPGGNAGESFYVRMGANLAFANSENTTFGQIVKTCAYTYAARPEWKFQYNLDLIHDKAAHKLSMVALTEDPSAPLPQYIYAGSPSYDHAWTSKNVGESNVTGVRDVITQHTPDTPMNYAEIELLLARENKEVPWNQYKVKFIIANSKDENTREDNSDIYEPTKQRTEDRIVVGNPLLYPGEYIQELQIIPMGADGTEEGVLTPGNSFGSRYIPGAWPELTWPNGKSMLEIGTPSGVNGYAFSKTKRTLHYIDAEGKDVVVDPKGGRNIATVFYMPHNTSDNTVTMTSTNATNVFPLDEVEYTLVGTHNGVQSIVGWKNPRIVVRVPKVLQAPTVSEATTSDKDNPTATVTITTLPSDDTYNYYQFTLANHSKPETELKNEFSFPITFTVADGAAPGTYPIDSILLSSAPGTEYHNYKGKSTVDEYEKYGFKAEDEYYQVTEGATSLVVASVDRISANTAMKSDSPSDNWLSGVVLPTKPGGTVQVRAVINNTGNTTYKNLKLYNILPHENDQRGQVDSSTANITLINVDSDLNNATPIVKYTNTGADTLTPYTQANLQEENNLAGSWSTDKLGDATAVLIDFGDAQIAPMQTATVTLTFKIGDKADQTAYDQFKYSLVEQGGSEFATTSTVSAFSTKSIALAFDQNLPEKAKGTVQNMPETQSGTFGIGENTLTIPATPPTLAGATFKGWNTQADGGGTAYSSGNSIEFTESKTITLYAQWKIPLEITATDFTVKLSKPDGLNLQELALVSAYQAGFPETGIQDGVTVTVTPETLPNAKGSYTLTFTATADGMVSAEKKVVATVYDADEVTVDPNKGEAIQANNFTVKKSELPASGASAEDILGFYVTKSSATAWTTDGNNTSVDIVKVSPNNIATAGVHDVTLSTQKGTSVTIKMTVEDDTVTTVIFKNGDTDVATVTWIGDAESIATANKALPANPTLDDHEFVEWNTNKDGTGKSFTAKSTVTNGSTTTVYAKFKSLIYTVTFDYNGARDNSYDQVAYNKAIPEPQKPEWHGYQFKHWVDESGKVWDFANNKMPANEITLTAQWKAILVITANDFTVELSKLEGLNLQGAADVSAYQTDNEIIGIQDGVTVIVNPEKLLNEIGSHKLTFTATADGMVSASITVVATVYDADEVTVNPDNGEAIQASNFTVKKSELPASGDSAEDILGFYVTGSSATAWTTDGNNTSVDIVKVSPNNIATAGVHAVTLSTQKGTSVTIEVTVEEDIVTTVIFKNGDTEVGTVTWIGDAESIATANKALPANPTLVGHDFVGWNTKEDGTGKSFTVNSTVTNGSTTTVYAKFVTLEYQVTFDYNGARADGYAQVAYNKAIPEPQKPEWHGYQFKHWVDESGKVWDFANNTMPAKKITLTAKWEQTIFTVTFVSQGKTFATQKVSVGNKVQFVAAPEVGGHHFVGYGVNTSTTYRWNFDSPMPAMNMMLTALYDVNTAPEPTPTPMPTTPPSSSEEDDSSSSTPDSDSDSDDGEDTDLTPTPTPAPITVPDSTPGSNSDGSSGPTGGGEDAPKPNRVVVHNTDGSTAEVSLSTLGETDIPLLGFGSGTWALFSLILSVIAAITSVVVLLDVLVKRKNNKLDRILKIAVGIIGVAALVIFLLATTFSHTMVLMNASTIWFALAFAVQIGMIIVTTLLNEKQNPQQAEA